MLVFLISKNKLNALIKLQGFLDYIKNWKSLICLLKSAKCNLERRKDEYFGK